MPSQQTVGALVVKLTGDGSNYQRMLASAQAQTVAAGRAIGGAMKSVGGMAANAVGTLATMGGGAAVAGASWGIKLAADAEQAKVAFGVMLGSAAEADKMLKSLETFAATTPFEIPGVTQAAKSLLAFGVQAKDIEPSLRALGDVSAGVGAPLEELATIYGKAKVQGRLFAEDINQMTGRGIPLIQELAKQFGVAESEVRVLVEKGQVNFANLEKAFQSLSGEGGKFAGMMDAQSKTVAGRFSTMKDSVAMALKEVGQSLIDAFDLKQVMLNITEFVDKYKASFVEQIKAGLRVVNFAFNNWSELIDLSLNMGLLNVMSFANDVCFFFTDVVPAAIKVLPAALEEAFTVMLTNSTNFVEALWAVLQGEDWSFAWVGMSDGFRKELEKIPSISDRKVGALEAAQKSYVDAQTLKLANAWNATAPEVAKVTTEAVKTVTESATNEAIKQIAKVTGSVNAAFMNNSAVREGSDDFYFLMQQVPKAAPNPVPRDRMADFMDWSGKALKTENATDTKLFERIAKGVERQVIEVAPAGL
ncbi:MAG: tape measure protein [Pirellulaceae bacterium]